MAEAFGPFVLLRPIGSGSHGELFLADYAPGQKRAPGAPRDRFVVKRLFAEVAGHGAIRSRFAREAALASRLRHRNLVSAFDTGELEGRPYLALEWIDGPTLAARLSGGALEPPAALAIAGQLCAALDHLHKAGFAHLDVNPSNVLLDPGAGARLTDLGVAGPVGQRQPQVLGTYGYMAPEQVRGEPVDARADVFAVGVVLWEALAGRRLFRRSAPQLTLMASAEDPAPALDDAALDAAVQPALAKDPSERYASCAELAEALRLARRSS